jgi:hypothetical protein
VDKNEVWTIPKYGGFSKARWTPYEGFPVRGRVKTVVIRGQTVFMDGQFLVQPGFGKNIRLASQETEDGTTAIDGTHQGSGWEYSIYKRN